MTPRRRLAEMFASGELAALVRQHKTTRAVAAALGMHREAFRGLIDRMRAAGELPGWNELAGASSPDSSSQPMTKWPSVAAFDAEVPAPVVPPGHVLRGVSTLVDETGAIKQQWIKTKQEDDDRLLWLTELRAIGDSIERIPPQPAPEHSNDDLLVVLPAGDPHVGLLSWHEDAGENFDMEIAERNLVAAFDRLISLAPAAAQALLIFIGDNTHADGQANTTTKGTRVDVDGSTVKMMRTTIRACRRAIDLSLARFGRSHVIVERGNHDELLSAMLKRLNVTLCGRACHGWAVDEGPLTCPKCISLSKLNKPLRQDPGGFYRTKTGKLADELGWPRPLIYDQWRQLAMQVEYEARWSRALAEMKAWELLEASLVKQGSEFAS